MLTKQETIQLHAFEMERLKCDLEFTDTPPESTIAHQVYMIHLQCGSCPEVAFIQTVEDRKEDLKWDLETLEDLERVSHDYS